MVSCFSRRDRWWYDQEHMCLAGLLNDLVIKKVKEHGGMFRHPKMKIILKTLQNENKVSQQYGSWVIFLSFSPVRRKKQKTMTEV